MSEVFNVEGRRVLVEKMPTLVCEHCGEATFSGETTEHVRRMVHGAACPPFSPCGCRRERRFGVAQ